MPAAKKPGRPPRKPADKQCVIFSVRLTSAEGRALETRRQREQPGMTLAGYARLLLTAERASP